MNGVWQKAADRIREVVGEVSYETWIQPLNFVALENQTATIEAPNKFFLDWIHERYLDLLRTSIADQLGEPVQIKLTLGPDIARPLNGSAHTGPYAAKAATPRPQPGLTPDCPERRALHPQLIPRYTFGEFVVGSSNQFAHAAALAAAN